MKYTNEQISKIYKSLPLDIREVIASVEYMDSVQAIGKKYKLLIDKVGVLSEETGFVLMGITLSKDFAKNIQERLEVSEGVAMNIVKEINEQIFSVVRESLKKIYEERAGEDSSLLGKTAEKVEEEELNREDILREIEDKEHHNLPTVNKPELHLEIPFPNEIIEKPITPTDIQLDTQRIESEGKDEKPLNINISPEQTKKKITELQPDILRTMEKDIFKAKMGGTVSVPKETVEIKDIVSSTKATQPNAGGKIDPYRERTT